MAKQTFTTGQVLTAAQMTSLQQTAMGGGSATAKTASYVLVAADAGTTVAMNAAGATTITVNTGLFAAGDTVFIQNLGAGATTITAGTATVSTAGSLILPQYDAGILYFTATGASIFYDYIQTGAASPLTTKGDLYTFSTSDARLAVGTNTHVLTADSAEATGLKWAAASGSSDYKLINTTAFSAVASFTLNSVFTSTYENYKILINLFPTTSAASCTFRLRASGTDTTTNYECGRLGFNGSVVFSGLNETGTDDWYVGIDGTSTSSSLDMTIYRPEIAATTKFVSLGVTSTSTIQFCGGSQSSSTQFDGLTFAIASGTFTGNVSVYGLAK